MRSFFYRNALLMLLAGLFTVVAFSYVVTVNSHQAETAAQLEQITEMEAQMRAELAAAESEEQEAVEGVLGTSRERIESDTPLIREFVETVSTWESGEEYSAARDSLVRRYKIDEQSQFLTSYFQEPVFNTDTSGNKYYVVDTDGLNSYLSSVQVKTLGVSGTEYRYMVLADVASSSNDGKASASRTSVIYLTLDGEGVISDVSGYAAGSRALTSQ